MFLGGGVIVTEEIERLGVGNRVALLLFEGGKHNFIIINGYE